ncbi:SIS domain-containing protein [Pseudohongiella sp.]|uniref:SIS domain-containing protein n=1 Tax=marine sediment metagenome TaxID=412755 RepID=A0A0F9VK75_9ZZZZ|nr:SIS domain-containing protein [Pseudohongiella sp.]HDZ10288.1 SIS domain-containing protein [Pseudohongiella sp.]HEA62089.1 SIS domain-containing protein [Pseudohongiella sp.]
MNDTKQIITGTLTEARDYLERFLADENSTHAIAAAAAALIAALRNGGAVYSCGNGGSMSDAMHFAEELTGRYRDNRPGLSATAISDPGHISCVANDFGYEHIFSRYLQARGRAGDCLFAISTSGTSKNVIKAAEYARDNGIHVVSLTGTAGSALGQLATVDISAGASRYADRVQEVHIKVIHILIELIERDFFPENYPV